MAGAQDAVIGPEVDAERLQESRKRRRRRVGGRRDQVGARLYHQWERRLDGDQSGKLRGAAAGELILRPGRHAQIGEEGPQRRPTDGRRPVEDEGAGRGIRGGLSWLYFGC